jgi:hypothetical protein
MTVRVRAAAQGADSIKATKIKALTKNNFFMVSLLSRFSYDCDFSRVYPLGKIVAQICNSAYFVYK